MKMPFLNNFAQTILLFKKVAHSALRKIFISGISIHYCFVAAKNVYGFNFKY
jgi:hypothetical protein